VHHDEDVSPCRSESCACRRSPLLRCRRGRSQAGRLTAPEVADIVSGGHWSADGKGGFYRALVVMAGDKAAIANVYLRWLSFGDAAKPTVVKSVPVKEINDQNLGNASIEIGGEEDKENEATIFVSSYDVEEDKDISLLIKATKPGTYTVAKAPPEGPEQGSGEGAPKGTPQAGAPSEGKAPAKGEKPGVED
jgi:ribosomal protein L12E/L44/L45/RPP1/RPP2